MIPPPTSDQGTTATEDTNMTSPSSTAQKDVTVTPPTTKH